MNSQPEIKRPTKTEAAVAVGAIAILGAIGVTSSVRSNNEHQITEKLTTEHNLEQAIHDGLTPDEQGMITVSNGDHEVKLKVRKEVLGSDGAHDTWSEVLMADGIDPAKLPQAIDTVSGEVSNNGTLSGSQPGEVAYIPDELYLPTQPNQ